MPHTDKYIEITNDWNYSDTCTLTSLPISDLKCFKYLAFVTQIPIHIYMDKGISISCTMSSMRSPYTWYYHQKLIFAHKNGIWILSWKVNHNIVTRFHHSKIKFVYIFSSSMKILPGNVSSFCILSVTISEESCKICWVSSSEHWSSLRLSMASNLSPGCRVPVRWATEPWRMSEIRRGSPNWRDFEAANISNN